MAKVQILFSCSKCDAQSSKWAGRCNECGAWGSLEQRASTTKQTQGVDIHPAITTTTLADIGKQAITRTSTGISELDRVLGGGLVPGCLFLLGGEPGIGKSTLSIQLAAQVPGTFYISGEESVAQIKLRADRLGIKSPKLMLANETQVERICTTIRKEKPSFVVIDSIQTIYSAEASGEMGNVNQIKACATQLLEVAKGLSIPICIIGHVTKDGTVAGPRTLEHLVDTVLYLEGDRYHRYRMLRAVKNRFGATDEVGIFDMQERGLVEVHNASASLLEERDDTMPGSIITALMEGSRPILVEIQALVHKTSFGYPVRKASGFDLNRLHVLIAVLSKRAGVDLSQYDVHLNVVGGLRANEPAADLAVCLAIASSFKDKAAGNDLVAFGEVGLGGEVRQVRFANKRIKECEQLGMKRIITGKQGKQATSDKLKIISVRNIAELIKHT